MTAAEAAAELATRELLTLFPPDREAELRQKLRVIVLSSVMTFAATTACRRSRRRPWPSPSLN